MTEYRRALSGLCVVTFVCVAGVCVAQSENSAFRGTWIGAITVGEWYGLSGEQIDSLPRGSEAPQFRLRKSRRGELLAYYQGGPRGWTPFGQQVVHFDAGDRAVVSAQNETNNGVETLAFTIAKVDQGTLLVYLWFVSNHATGNSEADRTIWAVGGRGQFRRIGH